MNAIVSEHYQLRGRQIVLGITAGVAAYKAAELARLLVKQGALVQVVMTPSAHEFIGAMTLQAITGRPVRDQLFDADAEAAMGHIELARWADAIVIAPATADFMAKLAMGAADNLLLTICLATQAPVLIAPAMNEKMWAQPATQENQTKLSAQGVKLIGPAVGEQACGDVGPGRMVEPAEILAAAAELFELGPLSGKRVMITAGPTREPIDAVRYLSNRSSGKMGYALANAARLAGAEVLLISGPVSLDAPKGCALTEVTSADEMYGAVMNQLDGVDIFIAAAAVADYRAEYVAEKKIKKTEDTLTVNLVKNPDILREVAASAQRPFCVGFAAETNDLEQYATDKLNDKQLDMIAANWVGDQQGFDTEDNALLVIWPEGQTQLPQQPKRELAKQLMTLIEEHYHAKTTTQSS